VTVPDVIARMQTELVGVQRTDGVACFTRLYLDVTQGVQARLAGTTFRDPAFLARLDEVFAGLYFDALDAAKRDPSKLPRAWAPLFASRSTRGIEPLQFALAGMSAHINRDLPLALVATCTELGVGLEEGTPQHADYTHVNGVLAAVEAHVKAQFLTGWGRFLDRILHRLDRIDDVVAMWDVSRARDAAWVNAEALWALRGEPALSAGFLTTLDRMVGLTARGLLTRR